MLVRRMLTRGFVILPVLVVLLLFGAASARAADNSTTSRTLDDRDNIVDYVPSYPRDCWSFFDNIFYKGDVWEAFCKKDDKHNPDDEIAVWVSHAPAGGEMPSQPDHYRVVEPGQSWDWSTYYSDQRRPNAARFAVFKDKLFLYIAKTYDDDTGAALWQKQIAPIASEYVDGSRWNPPGVSIWEHRGSADAQVIRGLVVKVINDTLYILFQYSNNKGLYLITSTDGQTFSSADTPIYTFTGKDCLLNGDVVTRDKDGSPLLAFVTKDDVWGGDNSTGACKLWTLDPATKAVAEVATLPNKYKELTISSGNVSGCTQDPATGQDPATAPKYGMTALQLWGIGWDSENVYHMQYVFNADGTGGAFNPSGRVDAGTNATAHIENTSRNRLTSCISSEPVADTLANGTSVTSLQQYARVWWWGSTDDSGDNAHGRSMKYKMDYLKNLGTTETDTGGVSTIQDSWVLLGVVNGLPPYYSNGTERGHMADNYYVSWGTSQSVEFTSTIESERTFTMSYKQEDIFGIPASSMGFSYSNAVQQKEERTQKSTISEKLTFSPAYTSSDSVAWGVFMAPTIYNEHYELLSPDKATDFDVDLYYTYFGDVSSLIAIQYDMTNPAPQGSYWAGVKTYPASNEYWDDKWTGDYTNIPEVTDAYQKAIVKPFLSQYSAQEFEWSKDDVTLQSNSAKNTLGVTAGAFGFEAGMDGSTTIGSSAQTTVGTNLTMKYAVPGWDPPPTDKDKPPDYDNYLYWLSLKMFFLEPLSNEAFWVPEGVKSQYTQSLPWCISWHVVDYDNVAGELARARSGRLPRLGAGKVRLSAGLRVALLGKMQALKAAYDRGDKKATLNILQKVINQIKAQSGKGIPAASANRWIYILKRLRPVMMQ